MADSGTTPLRVALVDDQAEFLAWARAALEQSPGFVVVGECSSGERALACLDALRPDLLLVDFDMPGMNGIELIKRARQQAPGMRMILMSLNDSRVFDVLAQTAGALGFLPKKHFGAVEIQALLERA